MAHPIDVRSVVHSGLDLLTLSSSRFNPLQTFGWHLPSSGKGSGVAHPFPCAGRVLYAFKPLSSSLNVLVSQFVNQDGGGHAGS